MLREQQNIRNILKPREAILVVISSSRERRRITVGPVPTTLHVSFALDALMLATTKVTSSTYQLVREIAVVAIVVILRHGEDP